jgi:hypothetical protein
MSLKFLFAGDWSMLIWKWSVMIRSAGSIVLVMAIVFALTVNVCLACPAMSAKTTSVGCCEKSKHCKMPDRRSELPHKECLSSPVDFSKIERPSGPSTHVVIPDFEPVLLGVAPSLTTGPSVTNRAFGPHSRLEVCLRSSVLLI